MFGRILLSLTPVCFLATAAAAQSLRPDDIVNQLAPKEAPKASGPVTRSLTPTTAPRPTTRQIVIESGREEEVIKAKAELPKVNLRVPFEYNSDVLTPEGKSVLQTLATALKDPRLQGLKFLVGGHTDAQGSDQYNQNLSERRAQSVRQHLTTALQVPGDQLVTMGFGEKDLANKQEPLSAVNRRVEIVTLPSEAKR